MMNLTHQRALSLAYIAPTLAIIPIDGELVLLSVAPGERKVIVSGTAREIVAVAEQLFTDAILRHEQTVVAEATRPSFSLDDVSFELHALDSFTL